MRRLRAAEQRLGTAQLVLDRRVRAISVYGPATGLGQLLGGASVRLSSIGRSDYIGAVRPTG
jgi:hypothetical protein